LLVAVAWCTQILARKVFAGVILVSDSDLVRMDDALCQF
jgi:hypothetical protein